MLILKRIFSVKLFVWFLTTAYFIWSLTSAQNKLGILVLIALSLVNLMLSLSFSIKPPNNRNSLEWVFLFETISIALAIVLSKNPLAVAWLGLLPLLSKGLLLNDIAGTLLHSLLLSAAIFARTLLGSPPGGETSWTIADRLKLALLPFFVFNLIPFFLPVSLEFVTQKLKEEYNTLFRKKLEEAQRISRQRTQELEKVTTELRELLEQQQAMLNLIKTLASYQSDAKKVMEYIISEAKNTAQVEAGVIMLEKAGLIVPEYSIDLPEIIKIRMTTDLNADTPFSKAFKEKKIIIASYNDYPDFFSTLETLNYRVKDLAIFPLIGGSKNTVGLLVLINSFFGYDKLKMDFLRTLGVQGGIVLENSLLHQKLKKAFYEAIIAFSSAIEAKDKYTHVMHTKRVADLAAEVAREMGFPEEEVERIWIGGLLHDVGKLAIPDSILSKQGPLTEEEREVIKRHPEEGAKMLSKISLFRELNIIPIILYHHERYDGKGYPKGLKGSQIPIEANIVAIADTYDAIATPRPYNRHFASHERAIEIIKKERGKQFYPEVVDAFLRVIERRKTTKKSA